MSSHKWYNYNYDDGYNISFRINNKTITKNTSTLMKKNIQYKQNLIIILNNSSMCKKIMKQI